MVIELIGTTAGLLYVWLMAKQNMWCWPIGLIYIGASYIVFFNANLYAELASHTVYLALTFYGWYAWLQKKKEKSFSVTTLSVRDIAFLILTNIILSMCFGFLLATYTNNVLPYTDALVAVLSFTGMWLSAKKKIENWHIWMIVNFISIGMYFRQSLYFYMVLYILFFIMAIIGHQTWQRAKSHL